MISVYEASNGVEAHMVLDLLERSGIKGRVDGEYLQGGVGELQAIGFVKVKVDEGDVEQAKAVIREWDALQQKSVVSKAKSSSKPELYFLAGILLGILAAYIFYNTPVSEDGIDYDGDGTLDERWSYRHYLPERMESDRDFNGKVDKIMEFDRKGMIDTVRQDNDFDGRFESISSYRRGNAVRQAVDSDGDGVSEIVYAYRNDLLHSSSFIDAQSGKPVKVQYFDAFRMTHAELDTDGDGKLDTRVTYDDIEEVVSRESI